MGNMRNIKKLLIPVATIMSLALYAAPFAVIRAGGAGQAPGNAPANENPTQATSTAPAANTAATETTLRVRITAYTSLPDETDSTPFITANGTHVRNGIVASNALPFGTKIKIPKLFGNEVFTVEDRMNYKIKNGVDIWMPTKSDAVDFGVAYTDIVVLKDQNISER